MHRKATPGAPGLSASSWIGAILAPCVLASMVRVRKVRTDARNARRSVQLVFGGCVSSRMRQA